MLRSVTLFYRETRIHSLIRRLRRGTGVQHSPLCPVCLSVFSPGCRVVVKRIAVRVTFVLVFKEGAGNFFFWFPDALLLARRSSAGSSKLTERAGSYSRRLSDTPRAPYVEIRLKMFIIYSCINPLVLEMDI